MNDKQLVKRLEAEGWREARVRESQRIFKHPDKAQTIVVPDHGSKDIATGTLNKILKGGAVISAPPFRDYIYYLLINC